MHQGWKFDENSEALTFSLCHWLSWLRSVAQPIEKVDYGPGFVRKGNQTPSTQVVVSKIVLCSPLLGEDSHFD